MATLPPHGKGPYGGDPGYPVPPPYPGQSPPGPAYPPNGYPPTAYPPPAGPGYPPPGQPPGQVGYPAHPGGYSQPPVKRSGGTVARVLVVIVILAVCGACGGFLLFKPKWDEYQFTQTFVDLGFSVRGFDSTGDPVYEESPEYVAQAFTSNDDLVEENSTFVEDALESLYTWSRDHGSTAPREDFAECFSEICVIAWPYRDYEMEITMGPNSLSETPRWDVSFRLSPE